MNVNVGELLTLDLKKGDRVQVAGLLISDRNTVWLAPSEERIEKSASVYLGANALYQRITADAGASAGGPYSLVFPAKVSGCVDQPAEGFAAALTELTLILLEDEDINETIRVDLRSGADVPRFDAQRFEPKRD